MLSYSSGSSGKGDEVDKVRTEIVTKRPDLKSKALFNMMLRLIWLLEKVKCQIQKWQDKPAFFPDLNTGNNTYKVQRNGCLSNWSDVTRIEQAC
jgi:phosphate acetyltransferase